MVSAVPVSMIGCRWIGLLRRFVSRLIRYEFPACWQHHLSASYTMRTKWADSLRLCAGVRNVFNDKGPFMPTSGDTYASGPGNFDSPCGGGVGRYVFAGAEVRFE
jgi:hypothetical protein